MPAALSSGLRRDVGFDADECSVLTHSAPVQGAPGSRVAAGRPRCPVASFGAWLLRAESRAGAAQLQRAGASASTSA